MGGSVEGQARNACTVCHDVGKWTDSAGMDAGCFVELSLS
jgi:hypothetical protein